jgi:hypothetical protein
VIARKLAVYRAYNQAESEKSDGKPTPVKSSRVRAGREGSGSAPGLGRSHDRDHRQTEIGEESAPGSPPTSSRLQVASCPANAFLRRCLSALLTRLGAYR